MTFSHSSKIKIFDIWRDVFIDVTFPKWPFLSAMIDDGERAP